MQKQFSKLQNRTKTNTSVIVINLCLSMGQSIIVSMSQSACVNLSVEQFVNVSIFHYMSLQMCQFIDVSVWRCINLLTIRQYQSVVVSICRCVPITALTLLSTIQLQGNLWVQFFQTLSGWEILKNERSPYVCQ